MDVGRGPHLALIDNPIEASSLVEFLSGEILKIDRPTHRNQGRQINIMENITNNGEKIHYL